MTSLQTLPEQPQKSRHLEFRRPIADILADLSKPIPQRFLDRFQQGKTTITYIPWFNACKLLDYYAPGWHGAVTHIHTTAERIFLTYQLSIIAEEGMFVREATGTESLKERDRSGEMKEIAYGDPSSNAESMAFRRAAAKFGLGLYLYEKD